MLAVLNDWRSTIRRLAIGIGLVMTASLPAKEYRIGYIDSDRVIQKYEAAVEAKKELDTEISKAEAQAESLKQDWEKAKQEYESQELTLSEEGKRSKLAEVEQRKRRYDSFLDEVYRQGGKIDQKNRELIAPIVEKINSAVSKLAQDEGFALVLDASKSEIVFAQTGLDLTDLVTEELNREFAPVAPTVTQKVVYAVMPVFELNDEARQDRVGSQIRGFVYDLVKARPKVEMVASQEVASQLQARGFENRQIEAEQALDVGRVLNADYVVFGQCSKQDRRIEFTLAIADIRLNNVVKTEDGDAARTEDLQEEVTRVAQVLLTSVEKP